VRGGGGRERVLRRSSRWWGRPKELASILKCFIDILVDKVSPPDIFQILNFKILISEEDFFFEIANKYFFLADTEKVSFF